MVGSGALKACRRVRAADLDSASWRSGAGSSVFGGEGWLPCGFGCPPGEEDVPWGTRGGLGVAEPAAGVGGGPVAFGVDGVAFACENREDRVSGCAGWAEEVCDCVSGCRMGEGAVLGGEDDGFWGAPGGDGCVLDV